MGLKKAFGAIEILIVIIIILIVYFTCFHNKYGRSNPFAENAKNIRSKQQIIDDKLNEIETNKKLMKEQIKKNLEGEY